MSGIVQEDYTDRREPLVNTRWTFDKSISYGDLLVTASLVVGGLTAYFSAEKRISQLEYRTTVYEETLRDLSSGMRTELKELKNQSMQTQIEVLRMAAQGKGTGNGSK